MATDLGSFGRRLLVLANVLAGVAAAGGVLVFYAAPELIGSWNEATKTVAIKARETALAGLVALAAGALLLCDALFLVYGRRPRAPLRHITSEAPGGQVRISRDALEGALRATGESLEEITRLRVAIEPGGLKRVVVRAHFMCPEGVSLQEASRLLRNALQERCQELVRLPEGNKMDYEIEFIGFGGKLQRKAPDAPVREADEPAPFTGPKYPIDDEDPFHGARSP
jgi:hypothetical protein